MADLRELDPVIPEALDDRAADNWRALLAIADCAGGEWPSRARDAAIALSSSRAEADSAAGVTLLEDIRDLFDELGTDRLSSEQIIAALVKNEERPWAEWRNGKPITPRGLAKLLKPFAISSGSIRLRSDETPKGYYRDSFEDTFTRYLPTPNSATVPQRAIGAEFDSKKREPRALDVADGHAQ
jgi:putative DNA primase/helicase